MDLGYFVGFSEEPDGQVSWVRISELWRSPTFARSAASPRPREDAKIAAIESILMPSAEGDAYFEP